MKWSFDFRRDTVLWLLAAVLFLGIGLRAVQEIRGRVMEYPVTVVRDDSEALAFKARADSIMRLREAAENLPININTASATQLETLDGIGPVLAARIVAYRDEHGPFKSVDQLDDISGIGPKRQAPMRPRCAVDSVLLCSADSAR